MGDRAMGVVPRLWQRRYCRHRNSCRRKRRWRRTWDSRHEQQTESRSGTQASSMPKSIWGKTYLFLLGLECRWVGTLAGGNIRQPTSISLHSIAEICTCKQFFEVGLEGFPMERRIRAEGQHVHHSKYDEGTVLLLEGDRESPTSPSCSTI